MNTLFRTAAVAGAAAALTLVVGVGAAHSAPATNVVGGPGRIVVTTNADGRDANCSANIVKPAGAAPERFYSVPANQTGRTVFANVAAGTYTVQWLCSVVGPNDVFGAPISVNVTQPTPLDQIMQMFGS